MANHFYTASDTETGGVPSYLEQLLVSPTGFEAAVPSLQANFGQGRYLSCLPKLQPFLENFLLASSLQVLKYSG